MSYLDYMMKASEDFASELEKPNQNKHGVQRSEPCGAQQAYKTFNWAAPVLTAFFWVATFLVFVLLMILMRDWTLETLSNLSAWAWGWIGLLTFIIGRYFGRWWAAVVSGVKDLPREKIVRPYNVMDYGIFTFFFPFLPMFLALCFALDAHNPSSFILAVQAFLAYGFVGIFTKGPDAVEEDRNFDAIKEEGLTQKIDEARRDEECCFTTDDLVDMSVGTLRSPWALLYRRTYD